MGLRESEVIGLRWSNVDLDEGTIVVSSQITRTNTGQRVEGDPKTKGSFRTVRLPQVCVAALKAHRKRLLEERIRLGEAWEEHGLVWPSERGTPLGHRNLLRHVYRSCERAGIRRASFHELPLGRDHAARPGVPETVIMKTLGHTDRRMVARYAHVTDELLQQAADAADRAFGEQA